MSALEKIKERVRGLSTDDLKAFRAWFEDFDTRVWDEQIIGDSQAGKLDSLVAEAVSEHAAGRSREL